ncbi:MAG: hypothetical protein ACPGUI_00350 [Halarcobacter sp.]
MKTLIPLLSIVTITLLMQGCSSKNNNVKDSATYKKVVYEKTKTEHIPKEELDFSIEYSPERTIFFEAAIIKEDGSIISDRTITLLPKHPVWTKKDLSISTSKTLSDYYNEKIKESK